MIFWSASRRGFFHAGVHHLPDDAVPISDKRHRDLLAANARGRAIVSGSAGRPRVAPGEDIAPAARAVQRVKAEARRRILAIAPLHRQSNDNALLAIAAFAGYMSEEAAAALDRRTRIDAVRAVSNAIEAQLATLSPAQLVDFDPSTHPLWETAA
ncbi:MAG: hypothetical protein K2Y20_05300 [Sphingomonas sp.]|nr:hypothetical protein [Sphingomonas sp.]